MGAPLARIATRSYTHFVSKPCGRRAKIGTRTPEVFISYRREDAAAHAGRLYDSLAERFGADRVFMDVDTLKPGVDFVERIQGFLDSADVLLVVINRGWIDVKTASGRRRLDDPDDLVRLEVGSALRGSVIVIPVLVGGATMPSAKDLPDELAPLARRNAAVLSDTDWRSGMARLVAVIEEIDDSEALPTATQELPETSGTLVRLDDEIARHERLSREKLARLIWLIFLGIPTWVALIVVLESSTSLTDFESGMIWVVVGILWLFLAYRIRKRLDAHRATAKAFKHEKDLYLARRDDYAYSPDPLALLARRIEHMIGQDASKDSS